MIRSSVSYTLPANVEILSLSLDGTTGFGNGLDNVLIGLDGKQTLNGLGGNDVLTGGAGADIFVIGKAGGVDVVTDFQNGVDQARLDGFGITSFSQVQSLLTQVGHDVRLSLPTGEGLIFKDHKVADFTADDFQLAINTSSMKLSFSDDFNALSLQSNGGLWRTSYTYGGIAQYTLPSNGEKQLYVDSTFTGSGTSSLGLNPFSITDGVLNITATKVTDAQSEQMWGYDYASGLLTTKGTFAQQYGYFEINAKLPAGQGLWPAFWLLPADGSWPPELDIFEQLGKDPDTLYMSTISKADGGSSYTHQVVTVPDATTEFHKYGVLWDKDHITFYIDGVEIGQVATPADMNKPMYMLLNLAVGGGWAGDPDPSQPFGGTYSVDYVHVYSLGDAPGAISDAGGNGSDGSTTTPGDPTFVFTRTGTDGADTLSGLGGDAKLIGGLGDDTYKVDGAGDVIVENANGGTDQVFARVSYTLGANVENLTLSADTNIDGTGNELANTLMGNSGDNVLNGMAGNDNITGGAGNDTIIGGTGNDFLTGSAGDDTFKFSLGDIDASNKGYDKIFDFEGAGQSGGDVLRFEGFSKGSTLTLDTSQYKAGYYTDGAGQKVYIYKLFDAASGHYELIHITSKSGLPLGAGDYGFFDTPTSRDHITSVDPAPLASTTLPPQPLPPEPVFAFTKTGTDGADTLSGLGGDAKLIGGLGNDLYKVDGAGDLVVEKANGGTDTVMTTVTYTLGANVENLTLAGAGNIGGTGNELANTLTGNAGDNVLNGMDGNDNITGGAGNDTITGGAGNDFMTGGAGNDTFKFNAGDIDASNKGYDKIFDFEGAGQSGGDFLRFEGFGKGSTLTLDTSQYKTGYYTDGSGLKVYVYKLYDSTSGHFELIQVASKSGIGLDSGDYGFFG